MRTRPSLRAVAEPRPRAGAPARRVAVYTAGLALAAAALGIVGALAGGAPGPIAWEALPGLLAVLVAAGFLLVKIQFRDEVMALDLFEAVLAVAIVTLPLPLVMIGAAAAQAIADALRRNAPIKATFNAVQWALAAGAGAAVVGLLGVREPLSAAGMGAVLLGLATVAAVNTVAFAGVIRIAERRRYAGVLRDVVPAIALGWALNAAFGVLFVAWHERAPLAFPVVLVPLATLHWAYRAHAAATADRRRLAGLHRASRALAGPVNPREAFGQFLEEVRDSFDCEAVDLVLADPGSEPGWFRAGAGEGTGPGALALLLLGRARAVRVDARDPDPQAGGLLLAEGWRDCLAAPVLVEGTVRGVLCAYDRRGPRGFEEGELAVLDALAGEVASALRKAELVETILEERHKLAEIVDRASDGIATLDAEGRILSWNPGFERISGYTAEEMVGERLLGVLRPRGPAGECLMLERWAHGEDLPTDVEIVARHGERRWLSSGYTRLFDGDGQPRLLIIVARDVTKAREVERMKDDFVATVSHELRTPLAPIKGWAATLLRDDVHLDERERRQALESILRQAERLERLVVNLLEVSRIEEGVEGPQIGTADAARAAAKIVEELRLSRPDRTVNFIAVPARALVRGDEMLVEQIVSNLVSNAMRYSPPSEPIEVRVSATGAAVSVAVSDRGPGIPPEAAEAVFERFRQLGSHLTRTGGGAGLGLYIARHLARTMGGSLTVRSEPGAGATFELVLPAAADRVIRVG